MVKGYLHTYCPQHPFAGKSKMVAVHRLLMESKLARYLKDKEQVHHINRNKLDNQISNLKVLSINEHRRLHATEDSPNRGFRKHEGLWGKIAELRESKSYAVEISKELGIPRRTVQRYLKEHDMGGNDIRRIRRRKDSLGRFI